MTLITNLDVAHAPPDDVAGNRRFILSIASFARPADVLPYLSEDVISDSTGTPKALVFPDCARSIGGTGKIIGGSLAVTTQQSAVSFKIYIFDTEPTNHIDSNGIALLDATIEDLRGVVALDTADAFPTGGSSFHQPGVTRNWPTIPFVCEPTSRNLYGLLVTAAFTPAASTVFTIALQIEQPGERRA